MISAWRNEVEPPLCDGRDRPGAGPSVDSDMGSGRWVRCSALVEYGLGLLAIAAGGLSSVLLIGGLVALAVLLLART